MIWYLILNLAVALVTFCDSTSDEVRVSGTIIESPNYPEEYGNNVDCTIKVRLSEDELVSLEILDFNVQHSSFCDKDFLEMRDGDTNESKLIDKICGRYVKSSTDFKSSGNTMYLRFYSNDESTRKGFRIKVDKGIPHEIMF